MTSNPQALAQQYKTVLQSQGYVVGSDGTVRRNGQAVPPWSWAQSVPELANQKVNVQGSQMSPYTLTPGFQESTWNGMAQDNGPFSKPAAWNPDTGEYTSDTDWGTILGTAAVGGLFAAPVVAGALGGSAATSAASGSSAGAGAGSAAAGGAGVASTAASGAGWFSPASLIPSAISGIASIYGANQQANANEAAAKLQFQSTEEALKDARDQRTYQQGQYANYLARLQPYVGMGTTAGSTLQNLLARSPYTNDGPLPQYSMAPSQTPQSAAAPQGMPSASAAPTASASVQPRSPQMVTLRAPNGSTNAVPADQVPHWLSVGAAQV